MEIGRLEKYRDEIYTCNRSHCGYCQEGCPSYRILGFEQYSSRGKMITARVLLEGKIGLDNSVVDAVFNCFLCGFCDAKCALFPTNIFISLRREIFLAKKTPDPLLRVVESVLNFGNPQQFKREERSQWAKNIAMGGRNNVLFFPGCIYSYFYPKRTQRIYQLLEKSALAVTYLPEIDTCCGYPVFLTGDWDSFERIARANFEAWKKSGVKKIVTPCPGCYASIGELYPKFIDDFDIEVSHVAMEIYDAYDNGKLRLRKVYETLTYHDPCDLSRKFGFVEEPRKILEAIAEEIVEPRYHGFFARCCGGGGLVSAYNPKLHIRASIERAKELVETQAQIITTACPTCIRTIYKGLKRIKARMEIRGFEELVLGAML